MYLIKINQSEFGRKEMKKLISIVSLLCLTTLIFASCNAKEVVKEEATKGEIEVVKEDVEKDEDFEPITLKAATNTPKSSGHYKGLLIFKELVEERTDGRVLVELYSDAVLGDEEQMIEGMQMGSVDVMMAAAAKYANFVPEMDIYSPPYTFKSWDHFKAVMDSEVNDKIEAAVLERRGDIYFGLLTDGVRNVFAKEKIEDLAGLEGLKLRTMTGPNETSAWKALTTNPTPLAYTELYAALQSGVVDGAENTMAAILGMKFYESCTFVYRTGHNYLALPFVMSSQALEKVPAEYRDIVVQAGKDTCDNQIDWAIENDKKSENILKDEWNVEVVEITQEDKEKAIELVTSVLIENAERIGMEDELEIIQQLAEQF